ncbi:hypothetical protein CFO_g3714 [Ceratocystis platani]|uniref:Uncharacterized protein n=1 Tax=Ceratocystis fimbriata f. sp. platani TaxID=88771 RepID=A0A0F8CT65_CERFI|nr:hypothetical protein CFO_g3714 [Ceratocystis platani]
MSTNEPSASDKETQANFAAIMKSLTQAMGSGNISTIPTFWIKPAPRSMDLMLKYCPKLTNLNWGAWSRNMIRNFKAIGILYLFKGLEEEDFQNAIDPKVTHQEEARDEADDLIYMDTPGPILMTINMARCRIIVVDDSSKYKWVLPTQYRQDALAILDYGERNIDKKSKESRADNALPL